MSFRLPLQTLLTLLCLTPTYYAGAAAAEVKVRGPIKEIEALVVPAKDWCSSVVSAELRGPKESFKSRPEDIQRLIAGTRIGVLEDCPAAELIRIRGVDNKKSLFLAYTDKSAGWSISVVDAEPALLPMLKLDASKENSVRKIALLETKSHMARIGIQGIVYDLEAKDEEDVRQNWKLKDIEGSTFLTFNRSDRFASIAELADLFANAAVDECAAAENLSRDSLKSGIEVRGFDCQASDGITHKMITVIEISNITATYVTASKSNDDLVALNRLIADGSVLY